MHKMQFFLQNHSILILITNFVRYIIISILYNNYYLLSGQTVEIIRTIIAGISMLS